LVLLPAVAVGAPGVTQAVVVVTQLEAVEVFAQQIGPSRAVATAIALPHQPLRLSPCLQDQFLCPLLQSQFLRPLQCQCLLQHQEEPEEWNCLDIWRIGDQQSNGGMRTSPGIV